MTMSYFAPNWSPFRICEVGTRPLRTRAIHTTEGIGDRLRTAAFAELQAREAFLWAAQNYSNVPQGLPEAWKNLAQQEQKHLGWLTHRMSALGIDPAEREVSEELWVSLVSRKDAREFSRFMASAEERGQRAGERFCQELMGIDPETASIFGKIAEEEAEHIRLAERFYPDIS